MTTVIKDIVGAYRLEMSLFHAPFKTEAFDTVDFNKFLQVYGERE